MPLLSKSLLLATGLFTTSALYAALQPDIKPTPDSPRNVILLIGDGMDDHQITIARNYLVGAQGRIGLDHLPVISSVQVLTVANADPEKYIYVADSANSATSMATGTVTSRSRVGTNAHDQPLTSILELAKQSGFKAGLVTTSSITDATPASFIAKVNQRDCEAPDMMRDALIYNRKRVDCSQHTLASGGRGSISEQLASSDADILLGGGMKHFAKQTEAGSHTVLNQARKNDFKVITKADELTTTRNNQKVLGLFADDHLPERMIYSNDGEAGKPDPSLLNYFHKYLGSVELPGIMSCAENPDLQGTPSLQKMTRAAINHLSADNNKGFFLMVESASIDKASHQRRACGQIGEMQQLLDAADEALQFASDNPETLILITADHGQAAQITPNTNLFDEYDIPNRTPGYMVRLNTPEGGIMAINYATNMLMAEEHTGVNVPLFANAAGAGQVPAMMTQPEIFHLMTRFLGLNQALSLSNNQQ